MRKKWIGFIFIINFIVDVFVTKNIDKLDKIIKATFGVSETELDCIDTLELIELVKEIYAWTIEKVKGLNSKEKNAQMTV